jgi:hypothetical protein
LHPVAAENNGALDIIRREEGGFMLRDAMQPNFRGCATMAAQARSREVAACGAPMQADAA